MDHVYCPGSKLLRQPAPELFPCPSCAEEVEIWTDELKADCPRCGTTVYRDGTMSCIDWCKHAEECVGTDIYATHQSNKAANIKRQLLERLKRRFGSDRRRYEHSERVLSRAEELLKEETDADWHIVVPAALLLEMDAGAGDEQANAARKILLSLGMGIGDVESICDVITHHRETGISSPLNSRVLCDAEGLADQDRPDPRFEADDPRGLIGRRFLTEAGRRHAAENRGDGVLEEDVNSALQSIRPLVQADGGDVELVDVTGDGVARIRLTGACDGCPMSAITVSDGIERHLTKLVPGLKRVVAVR